MILKDTEAKSVHLVELASLLCKPGVPADKQALIERELKFMRAGMKGESEWVLATTASMARKELFLDD